MVSNCDWAWYLKMKEKYMTDKQYLELAQRTLSTVDSDNIGHFAVGLVTESAEVLDAYKKHRFYGRDLDLQNLKEEIGDIMWYLVQLCDEIGYSLDQAKVDNITKLKKRYPDGFKDVVLRDTNVELDHIGQTYIDFEVMSPVDMTNGRVK